MFRACLVGVLVLLAATVSAQSPVPLPATDVTSADVTAFLNALPRNAVSDKAIRTVDVGGYRVGVFGVFRPKSVTGDANVHKTRTSEIYYMLDGAATLVTGGTLKDPKLAPNSTTNLRGSGIEGGVTRRLTKGDIVVIPGNTPHWWSNLEGDISYLIFRPDPEGRMPLK